MWRSRVLKPFLLCIVNVKCGNRLMASPIDEKKKEELIKFLPGWATIAGRIFMSEYLKL